MAIAVRATGSYEELLSLQGDSELEWANIRELQVPEDGRRIELIDGALVMTPAPAYLHQRATHRIGLILEQACPSGFEVFSSPPNWVANEFNAFIPDSMIVPVMVGEPGEFVGIPLLVVEVLSPSTRRWDLGTKKSAYAAAGLGSYWVVDPLRPSLTVFRLDVDRLVEEAHVVGAEVYESTDPISARVVPAELVVAR